MSRFSLEKNEYWAGFLTERKQTLSESQLREEAICRIEKLTTTHVEGILALFEKVDFQIDSSALVPLMIEKIRGAKQSSLWKSNDEINMGYYSSSAVFYTVLFHELSHTLLRASGLKFDKTKLFFEEFLCWEFSRVICHYLKLPYAPIYELLANIISIFLNGGKNNKRVNRELILPCLCWLEKILFNASILDRSEFHWSSEGVPILE